MNEFERGIRRARARQRRLYLLVLAAAATISVAVAGILVGTRGTPVEIAPDAARETAAVRVTGGPAVAIANVVYGLSDAATIAVRADGFREARRAIRPGDWGGPVRVELAEIPGRLVATTVPPLAGTGWSLDDGPPETGERLDRTLASGSYALRIDHPFFAVEETDVEIRRAETRTLTVRLRPVDGRLAISSVPDGARLTVDGDAAGATPAEMAVAGGSYRVVVRKDGFEPVEEIVLVTNDRPSAARRYVLRREAAFLSFAVAPPGGKLLLDGRAVDAAARHRVSAGEAHGATYFLDGYHPATRTVTLAPGEARRLDFRLKAELGRVELSVAPDADIHVDGRKAGENDLVLSLQAVPHVIEFRKAGYRTVRKTVTPSARRTTVVRARLVPERVARLAEAPRAYTNGVGIELRLFEPDFVTMGAPRHEPGQRANEFVRRVSFRRPFYAARHEVTNGQFAQFRPGHGGPAREPVTSVSWLEAAAFCNWLSAKEGLAPFYRLDGGRPAGIDPDADGYRLLTEAEWEWLARKAGRAAQTVFPWGDESVVPRNAGNIADESANGLTPFYVPDYNDGHAAAAPVGSYPAEPSGLFDLTGNVGEWVHDFYSLTPPDANEALVDPLGPRDGDIHVVKGASWRAGTRTVLRAAFREGLADRRDDVGFRIGRYLYGSETGR